MSHSNNTNRASTSCIRTQQKIHGFPIPIHLRLRAIISFPTTITRFLPHSSPFTPSLRKNKLEEKYEIKGVKIVHYEGPDKRKREKGRRRKKKTDQSGNASQDGH